MRTQQRLYLCSLIPGLGTMYGFPCPHREAKGTPVVPFPSPTRTDLPNWVSVTITPVTELIPLPCLQHPKGTGVWCCTGTGFTDCFPLDPPFQTRLFPLPSRSVSALHCTRVFLGLCQLYPHF